MLISYNNIKAKINLSVEDLCKNLVQLGHEVEGVEKVGFDNVVVGHVLGLEPHPNSERLQVATVMIDDSETKLQIVCGAPNVAVDQKVIVALIGAKLGEFDIEKTIIRDVESFGMLCSLEELGVDKKLLDQNDLDGIYILPSSSVVGSNAFDVLGLTDNIIEISLTANRGDCLSYAGLIRDLAAIERLKYSPKPGLLTSEHENPYITKIGDDKTKQLNSIFLPNVEYMESPMQLKSWLYKHDIKPQNLFVDVANYCMMTLGIPMHTYDADQISGGIMTQILDKEQSFKGLDGVDYELRTGSLIVRDQEKIVAVASVLGSEATKVVETTKNILVEIGLFDPTLVRKSATNIKRKTDASMRGEKNVDPNQIQNAFFTYIKMIEKFQNIAYSQVTSVENHRNPEKKVTLKFEEIKNILGIEIGKNKVVEILTSLGFEPTAVEDSLLAKVPSWRFDIDNDHDLIEEIIRVYSMDKIEIADILPSFNPEKLFIEENTAQKLREAEQKLLSLGLDQVITYSLIEEDRINDFVSAINPVRLMMPLSKNHEYYRQSLITSLIDVVKYNFARQETSAQIFEIANVYQMDMEEIKETILMSGVVCGIDENDKLLDFFDAKSYVISFMQSYNIDFEIKKSDVEHENINPYAHGEIWVGDKNVGFIATVTPDYASKIKHPIHVFEINLSLLLELMNSSVNYQKVSSAFKTSRDITFYVPVGETYDRFSSVFKNIDFLETVKLKDIYTGQNIDPNQKALTFNLEFFEENGITAEQVELEFEKIVININEAGYVFNK